MGKSLLSSATQWQCELCLLASVGLMIYRCPYSKVEESFNMQATHDLLHYDWRIKDTMLKTFDHINFPGVVPRTFVGSLLLSLLSLPLYYVADNTAWLTGQAAAVRGQVIVRAVLGFVLFLCHRAFSRAVSRRFGGSAASGVDVGCLVSLLTALQFHLPFYMSRTLPNTFGLAGCLLVGYACDSTSDAWLLIIAGIKTYT